MEPEPQRFESASQEPEADLPISEESATGDHVWAEQDLIAPEGTPPIGSSRAVGALLFGACIGIFVIGLLFVLVATGRARADSTVVAPMSTPAIKLAIASTASNQSTDLSEAARVGALAPDFSLADSTGTTVTLSSYRGRPVWVNFWATWCPPCRAEMPEMKKLYAKYKSRGLVLLGVDVQEDRGSVLNFVQTNGYDWQFLLDSQGTASRQYYVTGIPTHVFIDKQGVIQALQVSGLDTGAMETYLARILNP